MPRRPSATRATRPPTRELRWIPPTESRRELGPVVELRRHNRGEWPRRLSMSQARSPGRLFPALSRFAHANSNFALALAAVKQAAQWCVPSGWRIRWLTSRRRSRGRESSANRCSRSRPIAPLMIGGLKPEVFIQSRGRCRTAWQRVIDACSPGCHQVPTSRGRTN